MVGGGGQSTAAPSFFDCIRDSLLKSVVGFLFGNAWPIKGSSARSVRVKLAYVQRRPSLRYGVRPGREQFSTCIVTVSLQTSQHLQRMYCGKLIIPRNIRLFWDGFIFGREWSTGAYL